MGKTSIARKRSNNVPFKCTKCKQWFNCTGNGRANQSAHYLHCNPTTTPLIRVPENNDVNNRDPINEQQLSGQLVEENMSPVLAASIFNDESDAIMDCDYVSVGGMSDGDYQQPPRPTPAPVPAHHDGHNQAMDVVDENFAGPEIRFDDNETTSNRAVEYSMRLFHVAKRRGLSRDGYNEMMTLFNMFIKGDDDTTPGPLMSYFKTNSAYNNAMGVEPVSYDACPRGCMMYYGDEAIQRCGHCGEMRCDESGKPRSRVQYLPLIRQLARLLYDPETRELLRYRHERELPAQDSTYQDRALSLLDLDEEERDKAETECDCEHRVNYLLACRHMLPLDQSAQVQVDMVHCRWHLEKQNMHVDTLPLDDGVEHAVDENFSTAMNDIADLYETLPDSQQRTDLIEALRNLMESFKPLDDKLRFPKDVVTKGRKKNLKGSRDPSRFEIAEKEEMAKEKAKSKEDAKKVDESHTVCDKKSDSMEQQGKKRSTQYADPEDLWPKPTNYHKPRMDVPEWVQSIITVKADGCCGWRALAAQVHGNENEYLKIKEAILLAAESDADVYKKYITFGDKEYDYMMARLSYGLTPETEAFVGDWCEEAYWVDANTMAQVAADAFGYPVAVYQTVTQVGITPELPKLFLPLDPPVRGTLHKPLILHLVGKHYYSLIIKPTIRIEWPPVPHWHGESWIERKVPQSYKSSWRHLHNKKAKPGTTSYHPGILS